jgi:hypothetical protein
MSYYPFGLCKKHFNNLVSKTLPKPQNEILTAKSKNQTKAKRALDFFQQIGIVLVRDKKIFPYLNNGLGDTKEKKNMTKKQNSSFYSSLNALDKAWIERVEEALLTMQSRMISRAFGWLQTYVRHSGCADRSTDSVGWRAALSRVWCNHSCALVHVMFPRHLEMSSNVSRAMRGARSVTVMTGVEAPAAEYDETATKPGRASHNPGGGRTGLGGRGGLGGLCLNSKGGCGHGDDCNIPGAGPVGWPCA